LYWFCHEYLAALAEKRITAIESAPVKAQGTDHNEADDNDNGEDGMVYLKASKAKDELHKVRMSKCIISSMRMVTLLMGGEQWKYTVMQG
jgi:hypothetical protein